MADLERFLSLLESLRQALATLDRYRATLPRERVVGDVDTQNMVLFAMYRAVQLGIDLAQHVVAERGLPAPGTYREVFRVLADGGVVDAVLGAQLQGWAGFRNVIAHDYGVIDMTLVAKALYDDLPELHEFAKTMAFLATEGQG